MASSKRGPTESIRASDAHVPVEDAAFLRAVLEALPAFVVRVDPEERINYINHLRGGLTLQDVIGRPVREFIAADDLERFERAVERAMGTGKPCTYLVKGSRSVTESGAAHYEGHAIPIDHGDGQRAYCVVAADVSEHVARAEALRQSEEKLRIAVEATGIGLWTWDVASDRVEWDQRMVEIAGACPATASEYVRRIVHPDDRSRVGQELFDAATGRPSFLEHRIVRSDGQVRWLLPCGRAFHAEDGRLVRMTGGMLDVTAQRRTEEHLQKAQKLDAVGSLTAGVAHNFNNMLAVIQPAIEQALRASSAEQAPMLDDALYAARRASELVAQLMTFSGQRRTHAAEPHELGPIVERAASMCTRTFERQVRLTTAFGTSGRVACDPTAIEQVVLNLLINARDAVLDVERAEPSIELQLSEVDSVHPDARERGPERYLCIRVSDNGVGMSDAVRRRIFEPFFTTKPQGKGTGLGLATSYGIVRDHGGFITLESQLGRGTTVSVYLPLASAVSASARDSRPPALGARSGVVLVVDDEPAVRRVLAALLAAQGHTVHLAADGESAVAALDTGLKPDLILLDRSLPGWPVKRTLQQLRERAARTPILFFTGQDVSSDERAEVQDVLYKPLSSEELVNAVEHWIGRS